MSSEKFIKNMRERVFHHMYEEYKQMAVDAVINGLSDDQVDDVLDRS